VKIREKRALAFTLGSGNSWIKTVKFTLEQAIKAWGGE
jgi:hypothetical protein